MHNRPRPLLSFTNRISEIMWAFFGGESFGESELFVMLVFSSFFFQLCFPPGFFRPIVIDHPSVTPLLPYFLWSYFFFFFFFIHPFISLLFG